MGEYRVKVFIKNISYSMITGDSGVIYYCNKVTIKCNKVTIGSNEIMWPYKLARS